MNYQEIARQARLKVLDMIYTAQSSHIGSNFSAIDILAVLFEKMDLEKDELIISKGWIAASIYYFLSEKGIIPQEDLERYCKEGEKEYIGLIEPRGKFGLRCAGGSMGYGLPFGVGMALAKKIKNEKGTIWILMSDGEQMIGTTWESAAIASHHKLDNIQVVVDKNGFSAMGKTNEILNTEPLALKWKSFGWDTTEVDGHYGNAIAVKLEDFVKPKDNRPKIMIAHTIKGKGVKRFEGNNLYHYKNLSQEEYEEAKQELNG